MIPIRTSATRARRGAVPALLIGLLGVALAAPAAVVGAPEPSPVAPRVQDDGPADEDEPEIEPTKDPFLWRVQLEDTTVWLYGTIHIPDDRVLALPNVVKEAHAAADVVYTEIPLDMQTQMSASRFMQLEGGETIDEVLPEDVFTRLKEFLAARNMPLGFLKTLKPWVFAQFVELADYMEVMQTKPALDQRIWQMAEEKERRGLETVEEQVGVFDSLTREEQIQVLTKALDSFDERAIEQEDGSRGGHMEVLVGLYLRGDIDALLAYMLEETDFEDPTEKKLWDALVDVRNERMVERIVAAAKAEPDKTFFFAVGAAHYPGETGILHLMREAGLVVERVRERETE